MMSTAPPLLLSSEQAERLFLYTQEYRRFALTGMSPTQERNTTLRLVQALQGRLLALFDQKPQPIQLPLVREEITALKAMVRCLFLLHGKKVASLERTSTITDLGKLYTYIKQTYG